MIPQLHAGMITKLIQKAKFKTMEYQGKTEKQVRDSERMAFWGIVFFFITIILLITTADSPPDPHDKLKEANLTIDSLNKRYDSLKWKFDSIVSKESK